MMRARLRPALLLSILGACQHDAELEALERSRSATAMEGATSATSCEVRFEGLAPGTRIGASLDLDAAEPGLQLALPLVVDGACAKASMSIGLCSRDLGGSLLEPATWQSTLDVQPGTTYQPRVTLTDGAGVQTPCAKLDRLYPLPLERVCDAPEALCSADMTCQADTASDVLHCGPTCEACAPGEHGAAVCRQGRCELSCEEDYHYEAGRCRYRPGCRQLTSACRGDDCCAQDLISDPPGEPLTFIRGYDRSNSAAGIPSFQAPTSTPVSLTPFYLDRYEVTVARFRRFVAGYPAWRATLNPHEDRGRHPRIPKSGWKVAWNELSYPASDGKQRDVLPKSQADLVERVKLPTCANPSWTDAPAERENIALNCVDFFVANMFCLWDGDTEFSRLPSEAEWNAAAAGGSEQRAYPWSPREDPASLEIDGKVRYGEAEHLPYEVGASPLGAGRWGTQDLSGNVAEWVRDTAALRAIDPATGKVPATYDPYIDYPNDPILLADDASATVHHVVRGGSFLKANCAECDTRAALRTAARNLLEATSTFGHVGFRCARSYAP
jgi:formylglycine-generating enzyme